MIKNIFLNVSIDYIDISSILIQPKICLKISNKLGIRMSYIKFPEKCNESEAIKFLNYLNGSNFSD
jgi:hypothetical protein